jgi:hypothetical protein
VPFSTYLAGDLITVAEHTSTPSVTCPNGRYTLKVGRCTYTCPTSHATLLTSTSQPLLERGA